MKSLAEPTSPKITKRRVEVSIRGAWVPVPAIEVDGDLIVVTGKRIRIGALHDEEWLERELADPERCVAALRDRSAEIRADIFTFTQKPPATSPKYSYPLEWSSIAVAEIPSFKEWWDRLPQETRKNVRRSQKRGVVIRVQSFNDDVVRGIQEIQNECRIRQGRKYPHYGKSISQVRRDHSSFLERSEFICAYAGDEVIGFLKLVYRGDVASILQLNSKIAHYDKRPANALLAKAVELCEARRVGLLTYGQFNYGNKGDSRLTEFKTRNGFRELLVPRYYVPLNVWGRCCVKLRLYRSWMEILPRRVISLLVNVRIWWYQHSSNAPV
jgi:hypothetical protein